MEAKCYFCGTKKNLGHCALCKRYFCEQCKNKYPERVAAAIGEMYKTFFQHSLPPNERSTINIQEEFDESL